MIFIINKSLVEQRYRTWKHAITAKKIRGQFRRTRAKHITCDDKKRKQFRRTDRPMYHHSFVFRQQSRGTELIWSSKHRKSTAEQPEQLMVMGCSGELRSCYGLFWLLCGTVRSNLHPFDPLGRFVLRGVSLFLYKISFFELRVLRNCLKVGVCFLCFGMLVLQNCRRSCCSALLFF